MALYQILARETCEEDKQSKKVILLVSWTVFGRKETVEHLQLLRLRNTETQ